MRRIECDKCGRNDLAPLRPERFSVKVELPTKHMHVDLCERCAGDLERWLSEPYPRGSGVTGTLNQSLSERSES